MLKHLKSLWVVLLRSLFKLLSLKFSRMINCGRWSEIEAVMLQERYLNDGLFTKMLSISVADFSVSVICDVKLWLKSNTRKLYVPLFLL